MNVCDVWMCVCVLCVHVKVGYAREYGDNAKECTCLGRVCNYVVSQSCTLLCAHQNFFVRACCVHKCV